VTVHAGTDGFTGVLLKDWSFLTMPSSQMALYSLCSALLFDESPKVVIRVQFGTNPISGHSCEPDVFHGLITRAKRERQI
jgi:hypothetical protein